MTDLWIRSNGNRICPLPEPNHGRTQFAELDHNGYLVNAHETVPADAEAQP